MPDFVLLCVILLLLLTLLVTVLGFALYSGLGAQITVRTGSPPIRNIILAYKFKQGPYKDCGPLFTESCSIGPKLRSIGVFYDDPKQVAPEKCRYIVGSILSEGEEKPSEELVQLYQKFGFKIFSFPEVTHAVTTTFPFTTFFSIFLAVYRVYPTLDSYIKERKLCAHPILEVYRGEKIYYICPLARQNDFYVPEVREVERNLTSGEEAENGHDDITDGDSLSETSSLSKVVPSESRETSVASSVMQASVAPSSPTSRDQEEEDRRSEHSCSESGGSGSSFEELDLEANEEGKRSGAMTADLSNDKAVPLKEMNEGRVVVEEEKEE